MSCRERVLKVLEPGESEAGSRFVTTIGDGRRVLAPDIPGVWNNLIPNVSPDLKKNVIGLISQVTNNSMEPFFMVCQVLGGSVDIRCNLRSPSFSGHAILRTSRH